MQVINQIFDLPMVEGFRFYLLLKDGSKVLCEVFKDPDSGWHHFAPVMENRVGWIKAEGD